MSPAKYISLIFMAFTLLCGRPTIAAAKYEWVFEQNATQSGSITLYVTNDAFRIVNRTLQFEIVSKAPGWKAIWLKPSMKGLWIQDKLDLRAVLGIKSGLSQPATVLAHVKYKGLNCKVYIEQNGALTVGTEDVPLAPEGAKAICDYWSIPRLSEVPLRNYWPPVKATSYKKSDYIDMHQYEGLHTGVSYKFETTSWKKLPFKSSDFAVPANFKPIKDPTRMLLSLDNMSQVEDMFDNLMFTNVENKKANKSSK